MKKILNNKFNKCKRGQIGETLTWIFATFIIIGILLLFIYSSIALAKLKQINFNKASASTLKSPSTLGWIGLKNSLAFSLNDKNQSEIKDWLDENGNS